MPIHRCLPCRGAELAGKLRVGTWVLRVETFKRRAAYHQVTDLGPIEKTACGHTMRKEKSFA